MFKSHMLVIFFAALSLSTLPLKAHADVPTDIYTCVFTTPYIRLAYNTDGDELVIYNQHDDVMKDDGTIEVVPHIISGISMTTDAAGTVKWSDRGGNALFTLTLTGKGGDGMRDSIYPYDIIANTSLDVHEGAVGGCSSTIHPMISEN